MLCCLTHLNEAGCWMYLFSLGLILGSKASIACPPLESDPAFECCLRFGDVGGMDPSPEPAPPACCEDATDPLRTLSSILLPMVSCSFFKDALNWRSLQQVKSLSLPLFLASSLSLTHAITLTCANTQIRTHTKRHT